MTGLSFVFVQEILLDNSLLVGPCDLLILNFCSLQWCFLFHLLSFAFNHFNVISFSMSNDI